MALLEFEKAWKKRFERFAGGRTDAAVAGWSISGLESRLSFFDNTFKAKPGTLWLDVGCGAGTYCRRLKELKIEAIGLDYCFTSLQRARIYPKQMISRGGAELSNNRSVVPLQDCCENSEGNNAENSSVKGISKGCWLSGSATQLPFQSKSFQGILCFGVSQAVASEVLLIKELKRVLQVGGTLWLDGLNSWSFVNRIQTIKRAIQKKPQHLHYTHPWRIKKMLKDLGFEVKLYYAPIFPGVLACLNKWFLSTWMQKVYQKVPFLAIGISHAYYCEATLVSVMPSLRAPNPLRSQIS